jgi:TRAP-type mannitol/chloroaromatic compound transport system permease small subunit
MKSEPNPQPPRGFVAQTEAALDRLGSLLSWVWLALIGVIMLAVILRFVFGIGRIELEELQWHLYAVGFLFGIVGCAVRDRHVRVDVFRERLSPRARDWVDFYGVLLFQIPVVFFVLWSAIPLVTESFSTGETSSAAGGLPYRFILKAMLPVSFMLLGVASLTRFAEISRRLFSEEHENPADEKIKR